MGESMNLVHTKYRPYNNTVSVSNLLSLMHKTCAYVMYDIKNSCCNVTLLKKNFNYLFTIIIHVFICTISDVRGCSKVTLMVKLFCIKNF